MTNLTKENQTLELTVNKEENLLGILDEMVSQFENETGISISSFSDEEKLVKSDGLSKLADIMIFSPGTGSSTFNIKLIENDQLISGTEEKDGRPISVGTPVSTIDFHTSIGLSYFRSVANPMESSYYPAILENNPETWGNISDETIKAYFNAKTFNDKKAIIETRSVVMGICNIKESEQPLSFYMSCTFLAFKDYSSTYNDLLTDVSKNYKKALSEAGKTAVEDSNHFINTVKMICSMRRITAFRKTPKIKTADTKASSSIGFELSKDIKNYGGSIGSDCAKLRVKVSNKISEMKALSRGRKAMDSSNSSNSWESVKEEDIAF